MTDREKLEAVTKGYNDLMALYAKQKKLIAEMLRESHQALTRDERDAAQWDWRKAAEARRKIRNAKAAALAGMLELAAMLEREVSRDSTATPI